MRLCISNPPYNLKWTHPDFAAFDARFLILTKENNANFAFIQTALFEGDAAVLILPTNVLKPTDKADCECLKYLVDKNLVEAVVSCPEKMFVSTSIAVCLLFLSKNKTTATIEFVDMRQYHAVQTREQVGQFGGNSHEKRTYKKDFNVFEQEHIDYVLDAIANKKSESGRCASVPLDEVKSKDYNLRPSVYIAVDRKEAERRSYGDIVHDLNRVISQRNMCKLTINKTLAKNLGLLPDITPVDMSSLNNIVQKIAGEKIAKDNHITFTASAVLKFENTCKNEISPILMMIFEGYKQHLYYLNNEENRYLAELRDAMLPDLMSGKIEVSGNV